MKNIKYVLVLIMTLTLSQQTIAECNNQETSGGEILGTLAGAAIGGLVGSQFGGGTGNKVAIGAGVVAGGFLGNKIGKSMSCQDQQYHQETTQNTLETKPTGTTSTWTNPDTLFPVPPPNCEPTSPPKAAPASVPRISPPPVSWLLHSAIAFWLSANVIINTIRYLIFLILFHPTITK